PQKTMILRAEPRGVSALFSSTGKKKRTDIRARSPTQTTPPKRGVNFPRETEFLLHFSLRLRDVANTHHVKYSSHPSPPPLASPSGCPSISIRGREALQQRKTNMPSMHSIRDRTYSHHRKRHPHTRRTARQSIFPHANIPHYEHNRLHEI